MAKVLLVEDDPLISKMMLLRLSMRNHEVTCAFDGEEGVEAALEGDFDIVLLDMHMPKMDGRQAATKLRESGYSGLLVSVTASVMSQDKQSALDAGCDHIIAKPIEDDFEDRIEAFIKESR